MSERPHVRIGSRGSELALWQARYVQSRLASIADAEIVVIKTQGDAIQHLTLDKVEGKGFFTKEIEAALLSVEIDIAVHSYKDLPTEAVEGLDVAAVPERADVADVIVTRGDPSPLRWGLSAGARVGTSSLRRKAQLRALAPHLDLVDLRGNVPTRVGKVTHGDLDAVVLAAAGLERLGLRERLPREGHRLIALEVSEVCPAPAQGALAIQCRQKDTRVRALLAPLHHAPTAQAVSIERALLSRFGGGCHLPLGAYCSAVGTSFLLQALVAAPDGSARLSAQEQGSDATKVVATVYAKLVSAGAERYL